jgi:hypothetical protein
MIAMRGSLPIFGVRGSMSYCKRNIIVTFPAINKMYRRRLRSQKVSNVSHSLSSKFQMAAEYSRLNENAISDLSCVCSLNVGCMHHRSLCKSVLAHWSEIHNLHVPVSVYARYLYELGSRRII